MKLLHARIRGWTATFRLPLLYSGTGLTAPVPPYSTLLGFIGNLAAREIKPNETRIGYVFRSAGLAVDMETTQRFKLERGKLRPQEKGIVKRQFHLNPTLDLYLGNLDFREFFEQPKNTPSLGRSQDLVWIENVGIVEAESIPQGNLRGTLIPFPQSGASGQILNLPEYFFNDERGYTRRIGKTSKFVAVNFESPSNIARENIFRVENLSGETAIYLHSMN